MKRTGYLYDKIYEWENLLRAYKQAKKGKQSEQITQFEYDWETGLLHIQDDLKNHAYKFGHYHVFKIFDPKERDITCAPFRDRVTHHAICNVIAPYLEKPMIVDSYASRKGKGMHKALKRGFYFYQNSSYHYRLDIKKFYYTIDHEILVQKLERKFKDKSLIALLTELISGYQSSSASYFPFAGDDLFDMIRPRGIPIGNLTSQLFANYYLTSFDHFVREYLSLPFYVRYMDDMIVFAESNQVLKEARQRILGYFKDLRLHVNERKDIIQANKHGIDFLGFRFKNGQIRIRNVNLIRFRRKLLVKSKQSTQLTEILRSVNGHLGFLKGGHTKRIINDTFRKINFHNDDKTWQFILP